MAETKKSGGEVPATLTAALVAFQATLPAVAKDQTASVATRTGGSYRYTYADLADVAAIVLPRLALYGLAYTCRTDIDDTGRLVLRCTLRHIGGEAETALWPMPAGADPQVLGSAMTYGRRYALLALTGVHPSEEDDDGRAARGAPEQQAPPTRATSPVQAVVEMAGKAGIGEAQLTREVGSRYGGRDLAELSEDELRHLWGYYREVAKYGPGIVTVNLPDEAATGEDGPS